MANKKYKKLGENRGTRQNVQMNFFFNFLCERNRIYVITDTNSSNGSITE